MLFISSKMLLWFLRFKVLWFKLLYLSYFLYNALGFKGAHTGLKQFLATESPLKMMKKAFYLTLNALFALNIFKFLS